MPNSIEMSIFRLCTSLHQYTLITLCFRISKGTACLFPLEYWYVSWTSFQVWIVPALLQCPSTQWKEQLWQQYEEIVHAKTPSPNAAIVSWINMNEYWYLTSMSHQCRHFNHWCAQDQNYSRLIKVWSSNKFWCDTVPCRFVYCTCFYQMDTKVSQCANLAEIEKE